MRKISSYGKVLINFASSQVVFNGLKMIAGFLVIKLVIPEIYGSFTGVGVYLGYIMLGQFGVFNGLKRELPFELGRKHHRYANLLASSTWTVTVVVSLVVSLIFLYFFVDALRSGNERYAVIYGSYVIIGLLHLSSKNFLPSLYRTNADFNKLSRIRISLAFLNILSVSFLLWDPFYGMCLRAVSIVFFEFVLLFWFKPFVLKLRFKLRLIKKLLRTGLPIFLLGQIRHQWLTILNNIIVVLGGATMFGYYALANIVTGAIGIIPTAFNQVIAPKMAILLGEKQNFNKVLNVSLKPTLFLFSVMILISSTAAWIFPDLVIAFIPKYSPGIEAAQWSMFVPVILSLSPALNIYNVYKQQGLYYISMLTGVGIGTIYILIQYNLHGFSLVIFPQGIIIGTIIQVLSGLLFLRILQSRNI